MRTVLFLVAGVLFFTNVNAEQAVKEQLYFGGGLSFNSVGRAGNATGVQVFMGYDTGQAINNDINVAFEVGYMDSGDFDTFGGGSINGAEGVWLAVPFDVALNAKLDALMRVGIDFGDDDGIIAGAGMGYNFNQQASLRIEYVARDSINGLQFNLLFRL